MNTAIVVSLITFGLLALSSRQIGQLFACVRFPLISGYLFAGILVGPFVLNLVKSDAVEQLTFIDDLSLGFIAFAAGSELYLKELRSRFRSIASVTTGLVIVTYTLGTTAVFLLADQIPFMHDLPTGARVAVAMLAGSILVARSPSSAIAIVNELRAKGPFTKMALGVTVVMDVIVILFFALNTAAADILLTGSGFGPGLLVLLLIELPSSVVLGYVVSKALALILSARLSRYSKIALILLTGYAVFLFSDTLRHYTHTHLSFEILIEPLLVCLIGSFLVTNTSRYRDELMELLTFAGPTVYVVFFTLVGASLRLDILEHTLGVALVIFGVRLTGLFFGSFLGGTAARDPMSHNRVAWMAFITQAGVGLGLAKEVAVEFPEMGNEFSTLLIAVIVLSQLIGPPFFKAAIRRVGESHEPCQPEPDRIRDALILGIDDQSLALARQLTANNWIVTMADTDEAHVEQGRVDGVEEHYIAEITRDTLAGLITKSTDALIVMCGDDKKNYAACELAYEAFGVPRIIVRLNNIAHADWFKAVGAMVVDPMSAMVNLLDQFVRAPQSTSLLLHRDPEHTIVQITITNPDVDGLPLRDMRMPGDVLVLGISRDGHAVVPHGHTIVHLKDEVTLVGHPDSIQQATLRLGY